MGELVRDMEIISINSLIFAPHPSKFKEFTELNSGIGAILVN